MWSLFESLRELQQIMYNNDLNYNVNDHCVVFPAYIYYKAPAW